MADKFIHYSREPLIEVKSVSATSDHPTNWKPAGLWFSVGDGEDSWKDWCEREQFSMENLKYQTGIIFAGSARVLRISSAEELDDFHARYSRMPEWYKDSEVLGAAREWFRHRQQVPDWAEVGQNHDAIVIAPYIWERRLEGPMWYYGWDCASGCVWNAKAVAELVSL
jgi:hypothetical protein